MGAIESRPPQPATASPSAESTQPDGTPDEDDRYSGIVPTVFTWGFGGHSVYVTGAWDMWRQKIPLARVSGTDFSAILSLPTGVYQYKFIVDGNWKHSPALPTQTDAHGNLNNVVSVHPYTPEYDTPDTFAEAPPSPKSSYNFSVFPQEDVRGEPPALPAFLTSASLDKPSVSQGAARYVRLDHLFAPEKEIDEPADGVRTMATVQRYKAKYVTTILVAARGHPRIDESIVRGRGALSPAGGCVEQV